MAEIKYVNVLDAISQFRNYHTSIILTYGANLAFYEQGVLSRFWQSDCRNNLIFMDANQYSETTREFNETLGYIGRRYLVVPIDIGPFQSFHPKIILLLGSDQSRLLIGSGNLTFNGYGDNLELFTQIDWSGAMKDHQRLFSDVWNILITIQKRWGHFEQADSMLKKAELQSEWVLEDSPTTDVHIISSADSPILDQLANHLGNQKIERITIISPFLDNKAKAVAKLSERFSPKSIKLVLQDGKTCGDIKSLNKLQLSGVPIKLYGFEEDKRYLHAKLYAIEGKNESILAIGSANCTQAGLLGSSEKANFETLIIHKYQTKEILENILSKYISSQQIELTETISLRPNAIIEAKEKPPIAFQEIVLNGQSIIAKFAMNSLPSKLNELVLQFSVPGNFTLPIREFKLGDNNIKLSIIDQDLLWLNSSICAVCICVVDAKNKKTVSISNSLWLTNIGELNRRQAFLTANNEKAGQLLNEMHLGSDEDWRDLYNTISVLVEFELERIKSIAPKTNTGKSSISANNSEKNEAETYLRFVDNTEEDISDISNIEPEALKESALNSWLNIVFSQFPIVQNPNTDTAQRPNHTKSPPHKPNPTLTNRFIKLVRRYIRSLNNPDFMQSAAAFHLIAYFSVFQKIVWLLYKHRAIDENKLVKYICEIHVGFFGDAEDDIALFSTQELRNHLSWKYYQQWNDNYTHLFSLASLLIIKRWSDKFDTLFIQALANISSIRKPSDLFEDQAGLIQVANSYQMSQDDLVKRLLANINRLSPAALNKLEKWNTTTTLMLKDLENDEAFFQRAALVSIGIAAERLAEYTGNSEQQINYCTDLVFRTGQLNNSQLNGHYQEKLVELLRAKGNLQSLARAILDRGKTYNSERNYDQAIKSFLQAKSIASDLNDKSLLRVIEVHLSGARFLS